MEAIVPQMTKDELTKERLDAVNSMRKYTLEQYELQFDQLTAANGQLREDSKSLLDCLNTETGAGITAAMAKLNDTLAKTPAALLAELEDRVKGDIIADIRHSHLER
jgi:hypothetical protein